MSLKKGLCSILIAASICVVSQTPAFTEFSNAYAAEETAYKTGSYTATGKGGNYVRDGVWANKLGLMKEGTEFQVSKIDGEWGFISEEDAVNTDQGKVYGYVYLPLCTYNSFDISTAAIWEKPDQIVEVGEEYYVNSECGVWLRSSPQEIDGTQIGIIPASSKLNVVYKENDWVYVQNAAIENNPNKFSGWVSIRSVSAGSQANKPSTPNGGNNQSSTSTGSNVTYKTGTYRTGSTGNWVRKSVWGDKLGCISPNYSIVISKIDGEWGYTENVPTPSGTVSGWIYIPYLTLVSENTNSNTGSSGTVNTDRRFNSENEAEIYNFLVLKLKFNDAVATRVLTNIECESECNPQASFTDANGNVSYGICQWLGTRYTALRNYCQNRGLDYKTLSGQLEYLKYELTEGGYQTQYKQLLTYANNKQGCREAAYYWASKFEVCAYVYWDQRASLAELEYINR